MAFVSRNDPEGLDRVTIAHRDDGFVYFTHESDTASKLDRLEEAEFGKRYIDEAEVRLEESDGG